MRLLRWLGGLFGVMWLLITSVLWTGRPPDGRLQDMLLSTPTTSKGGSYALATIGDIRRRQLTPLVDGSYAFIGHLDNGKWLLFAHTYPLDVSEFDLLRVSALDGKWEFLDTVFHVRGTPIAHWSPDHQWLVYLRRINSQIDLMARRVDQPQANNLTRGQVAWSNDNSQIPLSFSQDGQWVYFQAPSGQSQHFFRARLDGSRAEDLTPDFLENIVFRYAIPEHDLFVLLGQSEEGVATLGFLNSNNGSFQTFSDANIFILTFLQSHQLLIAATQSGITAFHLANLSEEWHIEATVSGNRIFVSTDETRFYFFSDYGREIRRIQWDGTGLTTLYALNNSQVLLNFDPDSETLLYFQTNNIGGPSEIWRYQVDGSMQRLATFPNYITVQQSVSSDEWVIFQVQSQPNEPYTATYRIHPDGTGLERILHGPSWWNDVVAFGPKWELHWQPPIHAILGAALLVISLLRWPKVRNRQSIASLN